jgi:hypothetical protein
VIASVHVADVGVVAAARLLRRPPRTVDGLRRADMAVAATLTGGLFAPIAPGRVGLFAFWEDDRSLDSFLASAPLAAEFAAGWFARLRPVRAFGTWPGLPDTLPRARTPGAGPALVLTLGRLRWRRAAAFRRASAPAEAAAVNAPGMLWASGFARPPFVATCSLWESDRHLINYAYGPGAAHGSSIDADRAKPFHRRSAFIRFRVDATSGELQGRNPLAADVFSALEPTRPAGQP